MYILYWLHRPDRSQSGVSCRENIYIILARVSGVELAVGSSTSRAYNGPLCFTAVCTGMYIYTIVDDYAPGYIFDALLAWPYLAWFIQLPLPNGFRSNDIDSSSLIVFCRAAVTDHPSPSTHHPAPSHRQTDYALAHCTKNRGGYTGIGLSSIPTFIDSIIGYCTTTTTTTATTAIVNFYRHHYYHTTPRGSR